MILAKILVGPGGGVRGVIIDDDGHKTTIPYPDVRVHFPLPHGETMRGTVTVTIPVEHVVIDEQA